MEGLYVTSVMLKKNTEVFVLVTPQKIYFFLFRWSESNNWLVWWMRLPLRSGGWGRGDDINPHAFVLSWWSIFLFEPSIYRYKMDMNYIR